MRRVYYAFLLRQLSHPLFLHAVLLSVSLFAFTRIVSVPDVLANLMEVRVGEVAHFFLGALFNTEADTILWLLAIALISGSLLRRLLKDQRFELPAEAEWA